MTNIYILTDNLDELNDDEFIREVIPYTLRKQYGVEDKFNIITGDMINDAGFIANRMESDTNAWFIVLDGKLVTFVKPDPNGDIIDWLSKRPDEKATTAILAAVDLY